MRTALRLMLGEESALVMPILAAVTLIFAGVVYMAWRRSRRKAA